MITSSPNDYSQQVDHISEEYGVDLRGFKKVSISTMNSGTRLPRLMYCYQIDMADLFIVDEIVYSRKLHWSRECGDTYVETSEAIARIPERNNMQVVIRTYKGEKAEEVRKILGNQFERLTSFRLGNGILICTQS